VEVIDDDLGRSASGTVARPGFDRLVAWLCAGEVGAVLYFDASRLARNGRDWHHLLELCGLVEARVIDLDGVYDPCRPNDRLLLGMKGSISEFELSVLRAHIFEAALAKAHRGELRISVPIGYVWRREVGLGFDPDMRLQEAIRLIFDRFRKLGSARQVLLSLAADEVHFPRPSDGKKMVSFDWTPIRHRNVISVLKNPFYAGVYVYGKSEKRTTLVDCRLRKTYKHGKPLDQWDVMLKEHREAYIDWVEFERNQKQLALNAYTPDEMSTRQIGPGSIFSMSPGQLRLEKNSCKSALTKAGLLSAVANGGGSGCPSHGLWPCDACRSAVPSGALQLRDLGKLAQCRRHWQMHGQLGVRVVPGEGYAHLGAQVPARVEGAKSVELAHDVDDALEVRWHGDLRAHRHDEHLLRKCFEPRRCLGLQGVQRLGDDEVALRVADEQLQPQRPVRQQREHGVRVAAPAIGALACTAGAGLGRDASLAQSVEPVELVANGVRGAEEEKAAQRLRRQVGQAVTRHHRGHRRAQRVSDAAGERGGAQGRTAHTRHGHCTSLVGVAGRKLVD
jgi:DNA invertase Pin-like site-specific DNA recombinase